MSRVFQAVSRRALAQKGRSACFTVSSRLATLLARSFISTVEVSMRIIIAVLTLSCLWTPALSAQTLDSAARLTRPDDIIFVEDVDGRTIKGQLVALSETSIKLLTPGAVVIPAERVRRIDKLGDPVVDGFKRGALVGGVLGTFGAAVVLRRKDLVLLMPKIMTTAVEGGLIGMLFDSMHRGRTTVFRAAGVPSRIGVAPLIARGGRGVVVLMTF
jgi:hypothetical protein